MFNPDHLLEKRSGKFSSIGVLGLMAGSLEEKVRKHQERRPALIFADPQQQRDRTAERIFIAGCQKDKPLSITLVQYIGAQDSSITAYGIGDHVKSEVIILGASIHLDSVIPTVPFKKEFLVDARLQEKAYEMVCSAISSEEEIAHVLGAIYREQLSNQYGYPRK